VLLPSSLAVGLHAAAKQLVQIDNSKLNSLPQMTVELWARSDDSVWTDWGTLAAKRYSFLLSPVKGSQDVRLYFWRSKDTTEQRIDFVAPAGFKITQWHQYAASYDGQTAVLYVDGVEKARSPSSADSLQASSKPLTIGRDSDPFPDRFANLTIDDAALWNTALTANQIKNHYDAGPLAAWIENKLTATLADPSVLPDSQYPQQTSKFCSGTGCPAPVWELVQPAHWTAGFFPGLLWLEYQSTGAATWLEAAKRWTAPTAGLAGQASVDSDHDIGFRIFPSFGTAFRITQDTPYLDVVLRAAHTLAGRFDSKANVLRSENATLWPSVSGTPEPGKMLTAASGLWDGSPTTFTFNWYRCDPGYPNYFSTNGVCEAVTGVGPTYIVQTADVGKVIRVIVTATRQATDHTPEVSVTVTSDPIPPVQLSGANEIAPISPPSSETPDPTGDPRLHKVSNHTTAGRFETIIDNMMNLELLFWASSHAVGAYSAEASTWKTVARTHALTTLTAFMGPGLQTGRPGRPVGSACPRTVYDTRRPDPFIGCEWPVADMKEAGKELYTWARGQAWALYGFAMAYRYTRDERFLTAARAAATYYWSQLPADKVPYYALEAATNNKDSSAAAIAASGLLDLARTDPNANAPWGDEAVQILRSLTRNYLTSAMQTPENPALLLHASDTTPGYDRGSIWGDYYFLEALQRAAGTFTPYGGWLATDH
jgi:hypothetical protein